MSLCFVWTILLGGVGIAFFQILWSTVIPNNNNEGRRQDAPSLKQDRDDDTDRLSLLNHETATVFSAHDDLHRTSIAILPLADWEITSIEGNSNDANSSVASCHPPPHVSKQCCIGTFSMGGDIDYQQRYNCHAITRRDYEKLQQHATVELQSFSNDDNCDVCHILDLMQHNHLTMSFFGDSMTNQVVQGLICELQRRHYKVEITRIKGKHGEVCKRCIKWTQVLSISSPLWSNQDSLVQIKFFFQYRYPFYYPEEELEVATSADVLIINLGLHWSWNGRMVETGRMHYRKSMNEFLKFLKTNGTQQLLVYRETSAQHFDADGGDWGLRTNASSKACMAIRDFQSEAAAWRESKVAKAAKAQGYKLVSAFDFPPEQRRLQPELVVLPWWNFTAQHSEMHPSEECSHYCSSPFLYLPLWRSLRAAMDRQYSGTWYS